MRGLPSPGSLASENMYPKMNTFPVLAGKRSVAGGMELELGREMFNYK